MIVSSVYYFMIILHPSTLSKCKAMFICQVIPGHIEGAGGNDANVVFALSVSNSKFEFVLFVMQNLLPFPCDILETLTHFWENYFLRQAEKYGRNSNKIKCKRGIHGHIPWKFRS